MQDSAGAVIGALLGSWLLQYDFRLVCSAGAALFIACAAFNAWYLPAWKLSTVKTPIREGLGRVLRDKRFVTYVLTLTGYYMLAVQVMLMLPIMVNDIAGSPARREMDVRHRSHHFAHPALSYCPLERKTLPP